MTLSATAAWVSTSNSWVSILKLSYTYLTSNYFKWLVCRGGFVHCAKLGVQAQITRQRQRLHSSREMSENEFASLWRTYRGIGLLPRSRCWSLAIGVVSTEIVVALGSSRLCSYETYFIFDSQYKFWIIPGPPQLLLCASASVGWKSLLTTVHFESAKLTICETAATLILSSFQ